MTPLPKFFAKRIFIRNKFIRVVPLSDTSRIEGESHEETLRVLGINLDGETLDFGDQSVFRVSDLEELGIERLLLNTNSYYLEAIPAFKDLADAVAELRYLSPADQHPGMERVERILRDIDQ